MLRWQDNVVLSRNISEVCSDVVSCDVSGDTLVTGHRSGHIRVHTIHGQQTTRLVRELVTRDTGISVVSVTHDRICVGSVSGDVTLLWWRQQPGQWSTQCHNVGDHVTAACWTNLTTVCVGSISGVVSLVHCVTGKPVTQILELGSKIVQIESCAQGGLLVSSLTGSVLVNTQHKSFHQLGAKPRQGEYGACEVGDTCHVAARPGCRIWKVDKHTGSVIETCQFKSSIEEQSPNIVIPSDKALGQYNHGFSVVKTLNSKQILTYNSKNIYILDVENSEIIAWWTVEPDSIKEVHIDNEETNVIVLTNHGTLKSFSLGSLSSLLRDIINLVGECETRLFLQNNVSNLEVAKLYLSHLSKVENSCAIIDLLQNILHLEKSKSRLFLSLVDLVNMSEPKMINVMVAEPDDTDGSPEDTNVNQQSESQVQEEIKAEEKSLSFSQENLVDKIVFAAENVLNTKSDCDTKEISDFSVVLKELLIILIKEKSVERLTSCQKEILGDCFSKILSDQLYTDLCFHPLREIIEEEEEFPEDIQSPYAKKQLLVMFEQMNLDQDLLLSSIIPYLHELLEHKKLVNNLKVYHFFTLKTIIKEEEKRQPLLSPVPLDNIDETNVYDMVNLLAKVSTLSQVDILRYAIHVSQFDTECSIHLLQNFTLELPPPCILFFALTYFETLERAVKDRLSEEEELNEAVNVEFQSVLVRCLSFHIPGWMEQYQEIVSQHPALATTMFEAFKTTNESRLSKTANLVGSHKSCESLDTAALGSFLMKHFEQQGMEPASFCLKTSDMVGLARVCAHNLDVAVDNLAILVELGDVELLATCGLISDDNVDRLTSHLVSVYPGHGDTTCPVPWSQLAHVCLSRVGPDKTRDMLLTAARAKCIDRGSLSAQFYSKLIVQSLSDKS